MAFGVVDGVADGFGFGLPTWSIGGTSVAALSVCWRRLSGSGRYPAGSSPGAAPVVWPLVATKSRNLAIAAALALEIPPVGTIA